MNMKTIEKTKYEYKSDLHEAAMKYAEQGIPVFPIVPNEKRPLCTNGFKDATTDIDVINRWWSENLDANIGIPTGKLSGLLVIDVDVKNGAKGEESIDALQEQYVDPLRTRIHKTPSGGYHLIFRHPDEDVRCSAGKLGSGLDVRANGGYIVAPPSRIHGEYYEIHDPEEQISDAPEWLVSLALKRSEALLTAGNLAEGQRNNSIFKSALKSKQQDVSIDHAREIVATMNEEFNPPLAAEEVEKTLQSAYRYEVGTIPPEIEELNKEHAVVMVGGKCRVLTEIVEPVFGYKDIEFSRPEDFKAFFSNRYVEVQGKIRPLGDYWFSHKDRRQYKNIGFYPKDVPSGHYNLWSGFAVEPTLGDCSLYLDHIRDNISNGNAEINNYIIAWMADVVQNPDKLIGTALVLRGAMGVGKGVFANIFGSLFGRHYISLSQSNQLVGRFNGHLKDKVLLHADEAFWGGDKSAEGNLKSLVTEPYITIEEKGLNAYSAKNHLHMIFSTNNDWAVPAGPQERRFFVIDVGDKHMQDSKYFGAIQEQMKKGGTEALLDYLLKYDLMGKDLRKFPKTKALLETKVMSLTPVQKFWYQRLELGYFIDESIGWNEGVVPKECLYDHYIHYAEKLGIKHKSTPQEFGTQLLKIFPSGKVSTKEKKYFKDMGRKNVYIFPSLTECRKMFEAFINQDIEWPEEEQATHTLTMK